MDNLFIDRKIAGAISEAYRYFPVITLTGPRQSGKTTLLKHHFNQLPYYSLENLDLRRLALNDPVAFLNRHQEGMILDEVQHTPELFSYIQGIVDDYPEKRFVLSGSSQFSVLKSITQSLAGRTAVLELLPLSMAEVSSLTINKSIDEIMFDGFYPAIYAGKNIASLLYPSYVKTYLERDVRDLLHIRDMLQFHTFLRICAGRIGSLFNASEISSEIGVSVNTIKSWLSVLQASYVITLLPPYFENTRKRLTKTPKLYFCDTGLACSLLGIESSQQLSRDRMRGHLFENFIICEALKHRYNQGKESNLFFYRDSNAIEVDLLIKTGDNFKAIEIKSSQTYHPDFEKSIKALSNYLGDRIIDRAIVYTGKLESVDSEVSLLNYMNITGLF